MVRGAAVDNSPIKAESPGEDGNPLMDYEENGTPVTPEPQDPPVHPNAVTITMPDEAVELANKSRMSLERYVQEILDLAVEDEIFFETVIKRKKTGRPKGK
jgi:hypothetical protein